MKKSALVIGNAKYENVGRLKNPTNDSNDIKLALESIGFDVTYGEDVDYKSFNKTIKMFTEKSSASDILFFYYAGHGIQFQGNNFLIPTDANIEDREDIISETIDIDLIEKRFISTQSKANILILDSCRDNPFEKQIQNYSNTRNINMTLERGLANTTIKMSESLIAFATSPNEVALDNPNGRNGLFTKSLLKHIKKENLTIQEILDLAGKDILEESNNRQRPWIHNSIFKHKAILNLNKETQNESNQEYLEEINRLNKELQQRENKISYMDTLQKEINNTLNNLKNSDGLEKLEEEKRKLKALNNKVHSIKVNTFTQETNTNDNILVYNGIIDKTIALGGKDTFQKELKYQQNTILEKLKKDIQKFDKILTPKDEFESDIDFDIRKIEFEQEKIRFNNSIEKKIDTLTHYLYTKEYKEKVLNSFLGKQNIVMQYDANEQIFDININDLLFQMKIPKEIGREFKNNTKRFNIYFDLKKEEIIEINTNYSGDLYKSETLPEINSHILKTLFMKKYEEKKIKEEKKQSNIQLIVKQQRKKLKKKKEELEQKNKFFAFTSQATLDSLKNEINKLENFLDHLGFNTKVWKDPDTNLMWQLEIEHKRYCWKDIQQCADKLNSKKYGGYNDWRVPTIEELRTILTKERFKNTNSFTNITYIKKPLLESMTMSFQWFWSSSKYKDDSSRAWVVNFDSGVDSYNVISSTYYVRCVR